MILLSNKRVDNKVDVPVKEQIISAFILNSSLGEVQKVINNTTSNMVEMAKILENLGITSSSLSRVFDYKILPNFDGGDKVFLANKDNLTWEDIVFATAYFNDYQLMEVSSLVEEYKMNRLLMKEALSTYQRTIIPLIMKAKPLWSPTAYRRYARQLGFKTNDDGSISLHNLNIGHKGVIHYKSIYLWIDKFSIQRYVFEFNNFTYDSDWGLNLRLHPFLRVPQPANYGINYLFEVPDIKEYIKDIYDYTVCIKENTAFEEALIQDYARANRVISMKEQGETEQEALLSLK